MTDIALDYTSRISAKILQDAGIGTVMRYLSENTAQWKTIKVAEYQELTRAGITVILNWEYAATDWLGGAPKGGAHAAKAVSDAKALGYPAGSVLVGSCDFDMTRSQWEASGRAYARAFATGIRSGGYRPGVYGPFDVLQWVADAGFMDFFWQSMSTSFSSGRNRLHFPSAQLWQRGYRTVGGVDCDWNLILGEVLEQPQAMKLGDDKMLLRVLLEPTGAVYLTDGTTGWGPANNISPALNDALDKIVPLISVKDGNDLNLLTTFARQPAPALSAKEVAQNLIAGLS